MKVVRVQHVSVNCHGRLDETRAFYADLFETEELERPVIPGISGSWLALGDAQLHLVDAKPLGTPLARAELEESGIPYDEGAQGTVVQLWINDPCGRTIELQQAR